jgi:hypothetical protein
MRPLKNHPLSLHHTIFRALFMFVERRPKGDDPNHGKLRAEPKPDGIQERSPEPNVVQEV